MFPRDRRTELEVGYLRSGRIFRSGKRRKVVTQRGSCSMNRGEGYNISLHVDEVPCGREEEYQLISKGEDEYEEST